LTSKLVVEEAFCNQIEKNQMKYILRITSILLLCLIIFSSCKETIIVKKTMPPGQAKKASSGKPLPPGQAKKITGSKSAAPYAPGQQNKSKKKAK
jgi:hypothetical protein